VAGLAVQAPMTGGFSGTTAAPGKQPRQAPRARYQRRPPLMIAAVDRLVTVTLAGLAPQPR
jgi:hypothetical protein